MRSRRRRRARRRRQADAGGANCDTAALRIHSGRRERFGRAQGKNGALSDEPLPGLGLGKHPAAISRGSTSRPPSRRARRRTGRTARRPALPRRPRPWSVARGRPASARPLRGDGALTSSRLPHRNGTQPRCVSCEEDLQLRQLRSKMPTVLSCEKAHRRRGGEERERHRLHHFRGPIFLRRSPVPLPVYSNVGCWRARTETVEADVHRERHADVDRRRQNSSSSGFGYALPFWKTPSVTGLDPIFAQWWSSAIRVVDVRPWTTPSLISRSGDMGQVLDPEANARTRRTRSRDRRPRRRACARAAARPACREQDLRMQAVHVLAALRDAAPAARPRPYRRRRPRRSASRSSGAARAQVEERGGYGGSASPPSGSLIVRGAFSRRCAGMVRRPALGAVLRDDRRSR